MKTYLVSFIVLLSLVPALALGDEKLKVSWDCVLDRIIEAEADVTNSVDCIDLKLAFLKNPNLIASTPENSDLTVILRQLPLGNEIEYKFSTSWRGEKPIPWPGLRLNSSMESDDISERILTFLDKMTLPFIILANNGNHVQTDTEDKTPYYIAPSVSGSGFRQQGTSTLNASGMVYANYSTPQWRVMGSIWVGYQGENSKTTAYNPGINGQISYAGGYGGVVRDLGKVGKGHWNIAIFASDETVKNEIEIDGNTDMPESALENVARATTMSAGTEWIAVPFLTDTSNGNIAVHYTIAAEHHKYISPETFEQMEEIFARHSLEVYVARYFNKVDLKLGVAGFASSFRQTPIRGGSGSLEIRYKISPRVTLGATASLEYAKNRVMSTTEGTKSFMGLTSGSTPLTYNGSLSLTFNLGNIRIFNKEQRWKN